MWCKWLLIVVFVLFLTRFHDAAGQESNAATRRITRAAADSLFLAKNLLLLAEKFNVGASEAQVIQAKLFNNPTFALSQNIYNPDSREWFDISDAGETAASIQKLFLLAGKRNKRIRVAGLSYKKEEQHYFDMIRTLKYELRTDFYNIFYLKQILKVYDREIQSMTSLADAFAQQSSMGFVSKKEALRLKSSLFSLESEKSGYVTQLIAALSDFNLLLGSRNTDYLPVPDSVALDASSTTRMNLQSLTDTARLHRYDLLMARSDVEISQANLNLQKAMAVPDLTLMAGWDRNGSYVHNYNYLGMEIDLPFLNRNQGNIKSAEMDLESNKVQLQSTMEKVQADVLQAYVTAAEADRLYRRFDNRFVGELEALMGEMVTNYKQRNISTLEFLDFYDACKNNLIQLNSWQNARATAFEALNFTVGKDILNK